MNDYITSMKIMFPYKNMLDDEILTQWLESCWHHNNMQGFRIDSNACNEHDS